MKILFITHKFYPDIGGIEVNSEILAAEFHKAGHDIRLITWTAKKGEKEFDFPVIRNPSVYTLFKEHNRADLIYENNPSLRLSWVAFFLKKPYVVALRTWINRIENGFAWQDRIKLLWLERASDVIAVSEAIRKRCWPEAIVIGNPYRQDLFKVLNGNSRSKDFVVFGRLVPDKGFHIAIEALYNLSVNIDKEKQYSLTIVGNGPEQERLLELVEKFDLEKQVTFTGSLNGEPLVKCLNEHKYLLVPSTWEEPFGNVALEGMACGCLPIVSSGGGLPDAVGNAGIVVERGDASALAKAIQNLVDHPDLELKLRQAAALHLENHRTNIVAQRYLAVLNQAVKM